MLLFFAFFIFVSFLVALLLGIDRLFLVNRIFRRRLSLLLGLALLLGSLFGFVILEGSLVYGEIVRL